MLPSALEQKLFQLLQLPVPQTRVGTGKRSCLKPAFGTCHAPPAVNRGFVNAEDASDDRRGFALLDELDGVATTTFQFSCGSDGSCHNQLYGCPS